MENFLLWGFYFLTFYAFLPGLVSRTFGFRVFKRGRAEHEIALTFDDGPDPVYTPQLLDLLKRFDAKATFFVVGIHAERHPEILKRMHDEGHVIGIHNYVHKTNWLMRPRTVKKQIHRTSEIIRRATGTRSLYYRPPWGIVNLFDFSNLGYLQIILWSALFGDWRKRVGTERLKKRMMKKLRPGEVLLLHDCGSTFGADQDAPANMLGALEYFMEAGQAKGYKFVHITDMIALTDGGKKAKPSIGWTKRAVVACWMGWERLFHIVFRVKSVSEACVFYYRVIPYHGKTLELSDGRAINDKDPVVEIHFDNKKLSQMMMESRSMMQLAVMLIRETKKAMPLLARKLESDETARAAKGIYGVSMINRGVEQFGFDVLPIPKGLFDTSTRIYLKLLLRVLNPAGKQRIHEQSHRLTPSIVAMSMETFWNKAKAGVHSQQEQAAARKKRAESFDGSVHRDGGDEITHVSFESSNAAREFTP
ncbi:polysaccharide deacetylase family protein [Paenibacillus rhizovicinus]|uniref:Polysaccharide deacetylase family protein n=1 Tax=Paenibacillus rhizovicinus TaxID=2704463 RepID=A0A6C0P1I2_9BACL|nr:polysaccharide deacetylase family protein [Paenibacillus rhizovicinus]QHW30582.1 polysaccharide deacetylase family protein [Paenibacillus rhizovicinus]